MYSKTFGGPSDDDYQARYEHDAWGDWIYVSSQVMGGEYQDRLKLRLDDAIELGLALQDVLEQIASVKASDR